MMTCMMVCGDVTIKIIMGVVVELEDEMPADDKQQRAHEE